jgi:L-threonylcarbamoyladenylate synthase
MKLKSTVEHLRNKGCVLLQSKRSWALGVLATQPIAVAIEWENSKKSTWSCFVYNDVMLDNFVADVPEVAFQLLEVSEGKITLSFINSVKLHNCFRSADDTFNIRIASDQSLQRLIQMSRQPIAITEISKEEFGVFSKTNPCIQIENQDLYTTNKVKFYSDSSFKLCRKVDTR